MLMWLMNMGLGGSASTSVAAVRELQKQWMMNSDGYIPIERE